VKRVVPVAGDFYVPGLASDSRTGWVPGTPDVHRRLFLERAAMLEPDLLATLRRVTADDAHALSSWAKRWHLTDSWCLALARDTARWYAEQPDAPGWEFEGKAIFAGMFPLAIEPLQLGLVYYDPTWRGRGIFKKHVLERVARAVDDYCDGIEAAAREAGLKRVLRKRETEHFDWLVRYQIKDEPYASIAQNASYKFKGGRQTVRKAIVDLAEQLELTLRSST
jgi:GNAT superfamily N-acetyltransferase